MKGLLGEGGLAAGSDEGLKAGAGERILKNDSITASPAGQGDCANLDVLNTLNPNRDEVATVDLLDRGELLEPHRITLADTSAKFATEDRGRID
jgi:hypothetical protein